MSINLLSYSYKEELVIGEVSNLTLLANVTSSLLISFLTVEERHPRVVSLPSNVTVPMGLSTTEIPFTGLNAGKAVYQLVSSNPISLPLSSYLRFSVLHYPFLQLLSAIIGWAYFISWTVSFYPQLVQNFLRKSTSGYSVDLILMNILGYSAYSAFNVSLYWSPYIQEEYFALHPGGVNPVRINDVVFSVHGLMITLLIISQYIYYSRSLPVSSIAFILLTLLILSVGITAFLAFLSITTWLNCLYVLSYVKLIVTVFKYIPQVWINFRSKSTAGFNIEGIWLDFSGGILSILQMVVLAYNFNDWQSIFGDFVKFWLGAITIGFDVIFMIQHYILYRTKGEGIRCFGVHICKKKNDLESESLLGNGSNRNREVKTVN